MTPSTPGSSAIQSVLADANYASFKDAANLEQSRYLGSERVGPDLKIHIASDALTLTDKSAIERAFNEKTSQWAPEGKISINFKRQKPLGPATTDPKAKGPFGVKIDAKPVPNVKNIIAVSSGKGGVGKSTVTANLAVALSRQGLRVGIVDADIYGPSLPTIFGIKELPKVAPNGKLMPVMRYDIAMMTFGFFVNPEDPVAWRGPLVAKALEQLFFQVSWPEIDVLLIDMPPGTGDVHLTILEQVQLNGVITVTTPQLLSLVDVRKGLALYRNAGVPLLGLVENMSYFRCSNCGEEDHIFGEDLVAALAEELKIPILAQLPLNTGVRAAGDRGTPVTLNVDHPVSALFHTLSRTVEGCLKV